MINMTWRPLSSFLATDHGEESALAAAAHEHAELDDEAVERRSGVAGSEEPLTGREALSGHAAGNAGDEVDPRLGEPGEDLVERVLGLVRMLVLVHEPRLAPAGVEGDAPQPRVQEGQPVSGHAEDQAPRVGGQPGIRVVEPDDDVPARPQAAQDRSEAPARIP